MEEGSMQIGDVVDGKYTIKAKLGQGSFGAVYRAVQTNINRLVAIKVLIPKSQQDTEIRHRFKREAKLSSQLHNPHSIKIHDFGEMEDGRMFIVMEYLEGRPLDKILHETGAMTVDRTRHITKQVLQSLGEAHKLGIVHRDLKPENIFICTNMPFPDYVKVFDFGIAKVVTRGQGGTLKETAKLTMTGGTVGTPAYMSPEQCYGKELTGASDLYSIGVMMYEMLTGRLPFENANPVQTMMRQINDPPPPLPDDLANTDVAKAMLVTLEKKPEDRYPDAFAFLEALEGDNASSGSYPSPSTSQGFVVGGGAGEDVDSGNPTLVNPNAVKDANDPSRQSSASAVPPQPEPAPPAVKDEPGPFAGANDAAPNNERPLGFWVLVGGGIAIVLAVIVLLIMNLMK